MLLCASTSKSLLMTQLVMFMLIPDASALMFRSTAVSKQWDTWAFVENGTYYAYYLITEVSYGEGFGVATSPTGASEWTDHGYVWHGPAWNSSQYWQGTSSVWRAADFNSTGRYLINYSEMRPNNSQTITFAESFNLINWTRPAPYDLYFPINTTFYTDPGRWDTIYSVPLAPGERDGYPRLGYWTASPIGGKGTFGFGITDDGYHWTALASPVMQPEPIGAELGAVEWIPFSSGKAGGQWYAMLGYGWPRTMLTYSAPTAYGPWWRAPKNVNLLNGSCYYLRFFRGLENELLVTHQSWTNKGTHVAYIAPYKSTEVDDEGTLRLTWWKGNEHLKATELKPTPAVEPHSPWLTKNLTIDEISAGIVLEAQMAIPTVNDANWPGYLLELADSSRAPLAIILIPGGTEVAIGDYLPQSAVPYSPGPASSLPTTEWLFPDGATRMPAKDKAIGGSDIRSGGPGQTTLAKLAHPLDSQGHLLTSARVCFQYVAGYGCGPQAPTKQGATLTLALLDAVNGSAVADVWTSDELKNYSYDVFTTESPPICGGASGLSIAYSRQLQLALRFTNNECNVQVPMRTMNASVAWGGKQPTPYAPSALPSVGVTQRWTRDLPMGAPAEGVETRLLYRRDMVELYVNDYVFMAIDVPPTTGRVGLTAANATKQLRWWPMALPGGDFAERHIDADAEGADEIKRGVPGAVSPSVAL